MHTLLSRPILNPIQRDLYNCQDLVQMAPALITIAICIIGLVKNILGRNITQSLFYGIGTTSSFYFLSLILQFDLIGSLRREINRLQGLTQQLETNVTHFTQQNAILTQNVGQLEETRKGHEKLLEGQRETQSKLEQDLSEQRKLNKKRDAQYQDLKKLAKGQAADIEALLGTLATQKQVQERGNQELNASLTRLEEVQEEEREIERSFESIHENFVALLHEHEEVSREHKEVLRITNAEFLNERKHTVEVLRTSESDLKNAVQALSEQISSLNMQVALATQERQHVTREREEASREKEALTVDINQLRFDIATLRNELQDVTLQLRKRRGKLNASA